MKPGDWIALAGVVLAGLVALGGLLQWFASRFLVRFERLVDTVNEGFKQNAIEHEEIRSKVVILQDRFDSHAHEEEGLHEGWKKFLNGHMKG